MFSELPRRLTDRPALRRALGNVGCADLGDANARRNYRGPGAGVLADHPDERTITLLAISMSNLEEHPVVQLELPIGLEDEPCRPGSKRGIARCVADRAIDAIRNRFGRQAVGYGPVALGIYRSVPDEFRQLAERDL